MSSILSLPPARVFITASLVLAGACSVFSTDVKNPNAVEEGALDDPAGASILAIGLVNGVTRAFTSIYGAYSIASDELTWSGSRENWGFSTRAMFHGPRMSIPTPPIRS